MKLLYLLFTVVTIMSCTSTEDSNTVKLMTLDPGHFHAALIQKTSYEDIDSTVDVYAPEGPEVNTFLKSIDAYNSRENNPTNWSVNTHLGDNYLQQMISEKPGNVMVVSGKNSKKIDYIYAAVKAGLNVYADKPLVTDPDGLKKLEEVFRIAEENNVLVYDIMTERFEVNTGIQKAFSMVSSVFGELVDGTPENPAISKESIHHLFKYVSGKPLVRPAWFLDTEQQGEGIIDVTTHLVDLVQWEAFPNQIIKSSEIDMLSAKRWPTILSKDQFKKITGLNSYPNYLEKDKIENDLHIYCNGEMNYTIKGKHAKVSVIWNYTAPEGTGDTHQSIMRGTKSDLIIKQGADENFKPTLYINSKDNKGFESKLNLSISELQVEFPGIKAEKISDKVWKILVPDLLKIGHEAHFEQVTNNFLKYFKKGKLPDWEIPNMKAKYYTTIEAYKLATKN
ncbi:MAG: oxidoreductase [Flavobacteriaceae bacterium TMED121]|nr:MAG: oxidoreductase [Flavobacteriaceae bacterium TMED121]